MEKALPAGASRKRAKRPTLAVAPHPTVLRDNFLADKLKLSYLEHGFCLAACCEVLAMTHEDLYGSANLSDVYAGRQLQRGETREARQLSPLVRADDDGEPFRCCS